MRHFLIISFAKALLPSSWAACRSVRKWKALPTQKDPRSLCKRLLWPDHGQVNRLPQDKLKKPFHIVGRDRNDRRLFGNTGIPGAQYSFDTFLLCAIFHTRACSRPPPPTTSTFIGATPCLVSVDMNRDRDACTCIRIVTVSVCRVR